MNRPVAVACLLVYMVGAFVTAFWVRDTWGLPAALGWVVLVSAGCGYLILAIVLRGGRE